VRLWCIPRWLLNGVAGLISTIARITGNAPMLTPPKLRELRHEDWVVNNDAISSATGWTPAVGLREGLEQLKLSPL
jgi:nucleoside-diphosphate-sugar epimerase